MNIALFGYGKMGKMIERIALKRGHRIGAKIDVDTDKTNLSGVDVAIDFSLPTAAFENIRYCLQQGIPVISGTTGWLKDYDKAVELCHKKGGAFIHASNFSLGVNIFFQLNQHLARLMKNVDGYTLGLEEIHHTQKLDAPSGTAITLAEGIMANSDYSAWKLDGKEQNTIPITAKRVDDVPGTHTITYNSLVDEIRIKHTAHSREGFALGAVIAAEWIQDKTGVFSMKDVLNLG